VEEPESGGPNLCYPVRVLGRDDRCSYLPHDHDCDLQGGLCAPREMVCVNEHGDTCWVKVRLKDSAQWAARPERRPQPWWNPSW